MEFRDLKMQYQRHKKEIDSAVQNVLTGGHFIGGRPVVDFEQELGGYCGSRYCISCANGTDALQLALMVWGIGEGDAVFVPDFTFFSSGEVVSAVGATPVFVDVDSKTYNMDPDSLEQAIINVIETTNLKPRVIISVDLFGQPAEYGRIRTIADRYSLYILEDAAQGFGGSIGETKTCSFGDISTTSFFPAKPLGCYGDGGAVFTDHDEWAALLKSFCVHGKGRDKYDNVRIGMNSRLDTIQAAVLIEKLLFFDEEIEACDKAAGLYSHLLKEHVTVPLVRDGYRSSWAQYTIQLASAGQRKTVIQALKQKDIPSNIYYNKPMHRQTAFANEGVSGLDYKVTEKLCSTCLSLPMHAYLKKSEIEEICETVISCL